MTNHGSPQISQYFQSYNNLTSERKTEWNARVCSTVHAAAVSLACLYIVTSDEASKKDMIWGDSWIGKTNIAIASGYLLADMYGMWNDFQNTGGTLGFLYHHICALYAYGYVLILGVLTYFANFRLLAEVSTPFTNFRWFFDVSGDRNSDKYFYNGLLLTGTFFLFRILCMPYYYYLAYTVWGTEEFHRLGTLIQLSWIIPCIILDILNILWFYKILRGARKVIKAKSAQHMNGNGCAHSSDVNSNVQKLVRPNENESEKTKSD